MFKKKPHIKPLSPLRSSDRRKTADQIISNLGLEVPKTENPDPEDKSAPNELSALRNALLPENTQSARFTTTAGPDLKQVSGTVYVGSHGTDEQRILWVKAGEMMYPTVYTLWRNPGIVPLIHTPSAVVEKLQGGADLMTPGLQRGPPFPGKAKKGAIVAIAALEAPSVPMAVGVCEIDVSALQQVRGAKGHAIQTLHWSGDEVWTWGTTGNPGGPPPETLEGWDDGSKLELADRTVVDDEEDGGVAIPNELQKDKEPLSQTAQPIDEEKAEEAPPEQELTTKDIDSAFRNAFLYGVHHFKETNRTQQNFGLQFPLTQSYVMSTLVQPFLPAFTPYQVNAFHIKKTSWKNIKKFIKSLDKERIVKSKDRDGNEVVILDIDFNDRNIVGFVPYRLPKKQPTSGSGSGAGQGGAGGSSETHDSSIGQKLQKIQLYKPKEKHAPIFAASDADHRGFFSATDLRQIATSYIEKENLVSENNKRIVTLNPILANTLFDGSTTIDKEANARGKVPRDVLIDRFVSASSPYHLIVRNGEQNATAKPKAGQPPHILITLETRSGNKTVTKVSGVEGYFIPPQPFADELRKTCASSTSVEKLVGSSTKNPVAEIMVQGPQKDAVIKALEKRGVNKNWVEVVDKTKKKK